jgi:hypothetical protein
MDISRCSFIDVNRDIIHWGRLNNKEAFFSKSGEFKRGVAPLRKKFSLSLDGRGSG